MAKAPKCPGSTPRPRNKAKLPDPGAYPIKSTFLGNKLKFFKSKRVTEIQDLIQKNKWKLAPGMYHKDMSKQDKKRESRRGLIDNKVPKVSYLDTAIAISEETPSFIYNIDSKLTKKRQLGVLSMR